MPRGGRRVGSGRKPKRKKAIVIGLDGARRSDRSIPHEVPPRAVADLATPPKDLSAEQRQFWSQYAPYAVEQQTLVPATVVGFRELCEQWTMKAKLAKEIARRGAATRDAEGLLRAYMKLAQRVDALLARFKLTPFGKAVEGATDSKKPAASPWAAVAGR